MWTPPLKLLDGLWFSVDGQWLPAASRFTSGSGFVRLDGAGASGLQVRRTEVVPDGERGLLVGLTLRSATARTVTVGVDAHSELLSAYPWGETTPSQLTANGQEPRGLCRRSAAVHRGGQRGWTALVGALPPLRWATTSPARAPRAAGPGRRVRAVRPGHAPGAAALRRHRLRQGRGRRPAVPRRRPRGRQRRPVGRRWPASESGPAAARATLDRLRADPPRSWRRRCRAGAALDARTRLSLPGDPAPRSGGRLVQAEPRRRRPGGARPAGPRDERGQGLPGAVGDRRADPVLRRRLPGLPVALRHRRRVHGLRGRRARAVRRGRRTTCARWPTSAGVANGSSGKIVHEVVTDGSVYFGANADAGNTDESAKFPSDVALVWRWTGDNALPARSCTSAARGLRPAGSSAGRRWRRVARGGRQRGARGHGRREARQRRLHRSAGCWDLGDLAEARGDRATATWATQRGRPPSDALRGGVVDARHPRATPTRSSIPATTGSTSATGSARRRWRPRSSAAAARRAGSPTPATPAATLALHETSCYGTGLRLRSTPARPAATTVVRGHKGEKQIFTLNTAVMAVGGGQLRAADPAAALHDRQPAPPAARSRRATRGDGRRSRRPELYGRSIDKSFPRACERPAGVGQLRHRLAGGPPAARRAPGPRERAARRRPPAADARDRSPARPSASARGRSTSGPGAAGRPTSRTSAPTWDAASGSASAGSCPRARGSAWSRSTAGASCRSSRSRPAASRCSCAPARPAATGSWCGPGSGRGYCPKGFRGSSSAPGTSGAAGAAPPRAGWPAARPAAAPAPAATPRRRAGRRRSSAGRARRWGASDAGAVGGS